MNSSCLHRDLTYTFGISSNIDCTPFLLLSPPDLTHALVTECANSPCMPQNPKKRLCRRKEVIIDQMWLIKVNENE